MHTAKYKFRYTKRQAELFFPIVKFFSGLFDATDPEVEDIDDVVGLCSGRFATQPALELSQMTQLASSVPAPTRPDLERSTQSQDTQPLSVGAAGESQVVGLESQDTVILTGEA